MRVSRYQNIDVQLSLYQRQRLGIAPRHHLVPVRQPDAELSHRHHLLFRIVGVVVEVAPHYVDVARQRFQVVVRLFGAQVAGAQYVLDASGHQELFELGRQTAASVRNVEVS